MEKRRPHYPLEVVRGLAADPATCRLTRSAVEGGAVMGFSVAEVRAVVAALGRGDFYKSITTYHGATLWQDVYRPSTARGPVYLKVTVLEGLLVVSFKAR